jgi:hypothetical protein
MWDMPILPWMAENRPLRHPCRRSREKRIFMCVAQRAAGTTLSPAESSQEQYQSHYCRRDASDQVPQGGLGRVSSKKIAYLVADGSRCGHSQNNQNDSACQ